MKARVLGAYRRVVPAGHPREQAVRTAARRGWLRCEPWAEPIRDRLSAPLVRRGRTVRHQGRFTVTADRTTMIIEAAPPGGSRPEAGSSGSDVGIYLAGGCDLGALFRMRHQIESSDIRGRIVITRVGRITSNHPDLLLQQLDPPSRDAQIDVITRLGLDSGYFRPSIYTPTFRVAGGRPANVPRTVVVLSLGAGIIRTLYRHRTEGYLVDPGGFWMEHSMESVLAQRGVTVAWFRENFERVGRRTPDEVTESLLRLVREVQRRAGSTVMVFNTLTVEPSSDVHNYQLKRQPETLTRRRFHLALVEVAQETGCLVVDVDRTLKEEGVDGQIDFAHFPTERSCEVGGTSPAGRNDRPQFLRSRPDRPGDGTLYDSPDAPPPFRDVARRRGRPNPGVVAATRGPPFRSATPVVTTDVVVIGGGPGGATAALELARAGVDVTLVERDEFPRFQIGESLTGEVGGVIRDLGLDRELEGIDSVVKRGVHVFGSRGTNGFFVPVVRVCADGSRQEFHTWHVRRSAFDRLMVEAAADAGATVVQGSVVAPLVAAGTDRGAGDAVRGVRVATTRTSGSVVESDIEAEVVVDASGRATVLHDAGITARKTRGAYDRQIAVFSHVEQATRLNSPGYEDDTVILYKTPGHWAWFIPIDRSTVSIGIVCPAAYYRACQEDPRAFMAREFRELNPQLAARTEDAQITMDPRIIANYSYEIPRFTGPGWLCVGDSHRFIDPVFSFGVHFAMHEGRRAAAVIADYLEGGERRDAPNPFADFERYATGGQDIIQNLVDAFWGHPLGFGYLVTKKHRDDMIDLFAGRIYDIETPSAGLAALGELAASCR